MERKEEVIVYGTPVCPMVPPVLNTLRRAAVPFESVNVWEDEASRARLREINDGFESVPTLEFNDGATLTEPSPRLLAEKLAQIGYPVPSPTYRDILMQNPLAILLATSLLLMALLDQNSAMAALALLVIAFVWLNGRFRTHY